MRPSSEPEPPEVKCEQAATTDGPDWPENWLIDGSAFAIAWLGIATEERRLRGIEHKCLSDHRAKGHIR